MNKDVLWFSDLLKDINISATHFLEHHYPRVRFVLLDQKISDTFVDRSIAFYINDAIVCKATNRIQRNDHVNQWIRDKANEPFGKIFLGMKLERRLVSKTATSRRFTVRGDIEADIEEIFYTF